MKQMFDEKAWEEFSRNFSAYRQQEEECFKSIHAFWIAFFSALLALSFLKVWGLVW